MNFLGKILKVFACILMVGSGIANCYALDINSSSTPYTQDFDALSSSGTGNTWANNSTLSGWWLFSSSGGEISSYNSGTGSATAGSFYSFGADTSVERALGSVGSGGAYFGSPASGATAGWIAVSFLNNSGSEFVGFTADWAGEQWRNGGNTTLQTMQFEYGFGSSFASVASWIAPGGAFDFVSPIATSTAAAVDGNVAGRVVGRGGEISGLNWNDGDTLWLRWVERNDAGTDHGMAIDDFKFQATSASIVGVPDTLPATLVIATLLGTMCFSWVSSYRTCPGKLGRR